MKHTILDKIRQNGKAIILFSVIGIFYLSLGCPFRLLSGISCPGCGMSRAVVSLLSLDFNQAFTMHPLVFCLPFAVLIYFKRKSIPEKVMTTLCVFALILLLAVYLIRMAQGSTVVYADFESGLIYKLFHNIL